MAKYKIPVRRDIFNYTIEVQLEGTVYELTFKYNKRSDSWAMDISDIVLGINMVGGINVLDIYQYTDTIPPGLMFLEDLDGLSRRPTKATFGDRVILTYTDS